MGEIGLTRKSFQIVIRKSARSRRDTNWIVLIRSHHGNPATLHFGNNLKDYLCLLRMASSRLLHSLKALPPSTCLVFLTLRINFSSISHSPAAIELMDIHSQSVSQGESYASHRRRHLGHFAGALGDVVVAWLWGQQMKMDSNSLKIYYCPSVQLQCNFTMCPRSLSTYTLYCRSPVQQQQRGWCPTKFSFVKCRTDGAKEV